ncbi:hypothetical protein BJ508DRAFT_382217 [Ascobolus immersus RN42]|uniref:Uncharacterized protein n=1 Tax=Ascobolus immersus RN42 TaxID=1160509 RepID=A0A3N4HF67_ASCIM|nr:hypothetical protein BJ508DRAFT_382217 [Ascobolus immersus RN42]
MHPSFKILHNLRPGFLKTPKVHYLRTHTQLPTTLAATGATTKLRKSMAKIEDPSPPDPTKEHTDPRNVEFVLDTFKPSITTSFISESTHQALIDIFKTWNFAGPPEDYESSGNLEFLQFYAYVFTSFSGNLSGWDIEYFPPEFRPFMEEYLLFYARRVRPYFNSLWNMSPRPRVRFRGRGNPQGADNYVEIINALTTTTDSKSHPDNTLVHHVSPFFNGEGGCSFHIRAKAGLLRISQIKLVIIAMQSAMVQVGALLEVETDDELRRIKEYDRIVTRSRTLVCLFGTLRSERLEELFLRYCLDEDDVNLGVARGLEAAQRRREDEWDATH